jgi:hypothetical protein
VEEKKYYKISSIRFPKEILLYFVYKKGLEVISSVFISKSNEYFKLKTGIYSLSPYNSTQHGPNSDYVVHLFDR